MAVRVCASRGALPVRRITVTEKQFAKFAEQMSSVVCWDQGSDYAWEGDALMGADFFADVCRVMAKAPAETRAKLIAKWVDQ